ncbi:MAG TPA: bacillithiol biosynthesis cysteine-adding enzyme BshC [Gemmatimonadales bacterium]|nr:bacillithiol biosynthesis cysteine-adding enzyme BshC [Gemmatimonadales bacterium]
MTLRIVTTPLGAPLAWPAPREGGIDPALREAFVAATGTADGLARLCDPSTLVVTTGQQPGLLTGPLYTIHKALSAVALARICEERWRRPVVPVFWAAGGDHDFAEGNHASWIGADGTTVTMTLRERAPDAPLTPLYREPVGPEIVPVLERLEQDLAQTAFGGEVMALFRRWYRPEANLAESCAHVIAELLAPFGVLVFDATHPAVKQAQMPHLLRALERSAALDQALEQRHRELTAEGRDPGVTVGDGATLVMFEGREGRDRLVARSPGFQTRRSQEQLSLAEVERFARDEPGRFSPNVLLRPAIESALLPTVAYLAGPGELRYLALAEAVYQTLGIPRQLPLPRWSGIMLDARVDRVLDKYKASLEELMEPGQRLEARVVRDQLPAEARQALEQLRAAITQNYEILARAAAGIDPTIEKPVRNLAARAVSDSEEAEKKLVNHLKKRQEIETRQIARARELVLPLGRPQERVHTIAAWLARYGPTLLTDLETTALDWYRTGLEGLGGPS